MTADEILIAGLILGTGVIFVATGSLSNRDDVFLWGIGFTVLAFFFWIATLLWAAL